MIVQEAEPAADKILTFVEESVLSLREAGSEPYTILLGPAAYELLCDAVAARFGRKRGPVEQFQWVNVVVDPFRDEEICVVPPPREIAAGVRAERRDR